MAPHWKELRGVLEVLSYILKVDPEGVELYFTNSPDHLKARSTTKLLRFLDQHRPNEDTNFESSTDINSSLTKILHMHRMRMHGWTNVKPLPKLGPSKRPRPVTIYVLTDGIWGGSSDIDASMTVLLTDLEKYDSHSGVQFIRFGSDAVRQEHLARIDSELDV
jgi:exo-beta-1,3-glucanase (GH17 family)